MDRLTGEQPAGTAVLTTSQQPRAGTLGREVAVRAPAPDAGSADGGTTPPDLPVVKISNPADLVNLVPYLLQFRPGEGDLVVIGTVPPRGRVKLTFRWDLLGSAFQARRAVAALAMQGCTRMLAAGVGPDDLVAHAVAVVRQAAKAAGLAVGEALRIEGARCWSYMCTDASCCPPEGRPCGPADSPVAAAFQDAGAPAPLASRAVLDAFISPAAGAEAECLRQAMQRAEARADRLVRRGLQPGRKQARNPLVNSGGRAIAAALRVYQAGESITSHEDLAWLIRVLDRWVARDEAWLWMKPDHRDAHRRLPLTPLLDGAPAPRGHRLGRAARVGRPGPLQAQGQGRHEAPRPATRQAAPFHHRFPETRPLP